MLSDLFGADPVANQRRWVRPPHNPAIRSDGTGWAEDFIAPCSLVERDGELWLYAEGSTGGHEQIGLFTATADDSAGPRQWRPHPANPVLAVGSGFDAGGVFDPAVVHFGERWLLYYSATEGDAHEFAERLERGSASGQPADEYIGLAVSDDGVTFTRHADSPVLAARCPFVVVHDGTVHLFHVRVTEGGYRIHVALSDDGVRFREVADPVLDVGPPGSWDGHTVTTPKVFRDGDRWCLSYAGDARRLDDPSGIGLAYSDDLVTWRKLPGNPVFAVGTPGDFDSVSVASPVIRASGDGYEMWYAGSDRSIRDGLHSQVGVVRITVQP
ncbi:hypothetical protein [Nocardioides sp.]|uniref:hypothetical protein n=1 Tax=Nocardioides sp. TaxID=35761 RepID=UPI0026196E83|nr:hypothetical protein [Nocardioides sp.]MDI6910246.1 hypothetical protein [Nocardioides sp.]